MSCTVCNAETGCYAEDGIGVALWNSRVPAVPQWMKETPTEEGWYFLKRDMFDVIFVSVYRKGEDLWVKYPANAIKLADHNPALWCKIKMSPLPESK